MTNRVRFGLGVAYGLSAGVLLSTGGIALRLVEGASGWQILFYRALSFTVLMLLVLGLRYGLSALRTTRAVGWSGVFVALLLGCGAIAYVFAILHTSVANVVVLLSTGPLVTALLARVLLGERADTFTWLAMGAVVAGVLVMFADGVRGEGAVGLAIAMIAVLMYASMLVILRRTRGRDMLPATALSGPVTLIVAWIMLEGFAVSERDLLISVFLGTVQFGLGFMLITLATRHVPAAQVALLTLSEAVLAPIWVWIAFGELPTQLGMIGAAVVLLAVSAQACWALSRGPPS